MPALQKADLAPKGEIAVDPKQFVDFLARLERLKCNTRHSWTSSGRHESVAEHSWRLAVMALLLKDEFPALDMQRVIEMCLVHDWGEAVTGDIPAFEKSEGDERTEQRAVETLLADLPEKQAAEYSALFAEMGAQRTPESKLWRALDKLEALIQHNEASADSWLPLEHELQQTYGCEECGAFEFTSALRAFVKQQSAEKSAAFFDRERE